MLLGDFLLLNLPGALANLNVLMIPGTSTTTSRPSKRRQLCVAEQQRMTLAHR